MVDILDFFWGLVSVYGKVFWFWFFFVVVYNVCVRRYVLFIYVCFWLVLCFFVEEGLVSFSGLCFWFGIYDFCFLIRLCEGGEFFDWILVK